MASTVSGQIIRIKWNNVPIGTYSLTAKATDDREGVTTSAAHTIIVKANKAPAVALTAPEAEKNAAAPIFLDTNLGLNVV